ncbi:MAG: lectin like domain-containing protein [Acidobacteriota bacterium]
MRKFWRGRNWFDGAARPLGILVGLLFALTLTAGELHVPKAAPLNPDFVKYMKARAEGRIMMYTPDGYALGDIPIPVDLSRMKGMQVFGPAKALPKSYDLRNYNRVTPVKDQGPTCGACWAFATYGSLESFLMKTVKAEAVETRDLSEYHLIKNHGFSLGPCDGGSYWMSTAYLAQWKGPYNETDFPYPYVPLDPTASVQKHIQDVYWLPERKSKTDNNNLKQAIMNYGGVYLGFQVDWSRFNAARSTYYSEYDIDNAGHAVTAIGWNDSYSKNNFVKKPPANGAVLCKNSWGTGSGDNGYFWISYYDFNMYYGGCFNNAAATDNYSGFYHYDPLGCVNFWGNGTTATVWFANIFAPNSSAYPIRAVSFYAAMPNTSYQVYVYRGLTSGTNPKSGTLAGSKSGKLAQAGYHTVVLPSAATLTKGKKFSVVVKVTTPGKPGEIFQIPIEHYEAGYSSKVTAKSGQSFMSWDGTNWEDIATWSQYQCEKGNVCIKAFAKQ